MNDWVATTNTMLSLVVFHGHPLVYFFSYAARRLDGAGERKHSIKDMCYHMLDPKESGLASLLGVPNRDRC